ncbi:MAG TPA: hypothetical protein VGK48_24155 [Terriglobia bacterium]
MNRNLFLCLLLTGSLICLVGVNVATAAPQQRIPQSIVVNGQQTMGVTLLQNGIPESPNCAAPQPYTAVDQSSSGWACYDQTGGVWLLHAQPPQAQAYPEPAPEYEYGYPDVTPYYPDDYYPYGYYDTPGFSFGWGPGGPAFSFGLGSDHEHHEHGFERGHAEHGEHGGHREHGHEGGRR